MNGSAFDIIKSAAEIRGVLRHDLIAAGVVMLVVFIAWAIQEWPIRKSVDRLGWFGMTCLGLVGFGACALFAIGLL
jgi:hypothetical protein